MNVEKSFVIQTEVMSHARLIQYGLGQFDTRNASDHLPKVTDYSINVSTDVANFQRPGEYSLDQNYPNPFNPSTLIQYAISSRQFVTLKVYDILGNVLATLVNEELPAGNYNVEFDAKGLSSGIYFYRLQAAGFVEIKKMTLLK
jgi:hypothetical protein